MRYSISLNLLIFSFFVSGQKIESQAIRVLALGDSYTIGQGVSQSASWPYQLADSLGSKYGVSVSELKVIATTGWTTTNLRYAMEGADLDSTYDLVGLLIGVNNQYQNQLLTTYYSEFPELLNWAIALAGGDTSHVFVFSIPDYAYTPFGNGSPNISAGIDKYNQINDSITKGLGVPYYDITPISRTGLDSLNMVASDGLHPSGKQYSLWVDKLLTGIEVTPVLGYNTTSINSEKNLVRLNDLYFYEDHRPFDVLNLKGEVLVEQAAKISIKAIKKEPVVILRSTTGSIKIFTNY